jgi:hypothetical protein
VEGPFCRKCGVPLRFMVVLEFMWYRGCPKGDVISEGVRNNIDLPAKVRAEELKRDMLFLRDMLFFNGQSIRRLLSGNFGGVCWGYFRI